MPLAAPVLDLAYDPARGVLYLAESERDGIGVYSLASFDYEPRLPTDGHRPTGIDISLGGDSLVLASAESVALVVVDLTPAVPDIDTLLTDEFSTHHPGTLKMASNGRLIVGMGRIGSSSGHILEYELATGDERRRPEVGVNESTPMHRPPNHHDAMLLVDDASCCPLQTYLYDAASNTFGDRVLSVSFFDPGLSSTPDGSMYLIDNQLYDDALALIREVDVEGWGGLGPTALHPDGEIGYFGNALQLLEVDLSDGTRLREIDTEGGPVRLFVPPDAEEIVVFTSDFVQVFEL